MAVRVSWKTDIVQCRRRLEETALGGTEAVVAANFLEELPRQLANLPDVLGHPVGQPEYALDRDDLGRGQIGRMVDDHGLTRAPLACARRAINAAPRIPASSPSSDFTISSRFVAANIGWPWTFRATWSISG